MNEDWKTLLRKYMTHVGHIEGVDFVSRDKDWNCVKAFTDEEWEQIKAFAKETQ